VASQNISLRGKRLFADQSVPELLEADMPSISAKMLCSSYIVPTEDSCYLFEYVDGQNLTDYQANDRSMIIHIFSQCLIC
jgi:hypothetical protein